MKLKTYSKGQSIYDRAAHIWQVLVPWVMWEMKDGNLDAGLISYSSLAKRMGYEPGAGRTLARSLGAIAILCEECQLPALNTVVVRKDTGQAGSGVITSLSDDVIEEVKKVLGHDWRSYKAPSPRQFRTATEIHNARYD